MASYSFLFPASLPEPDLQALAHAYLLSSTEYVPWPTSVSRQGAELLVHSHTNESSCLSVPWPVDGQGRLLLTTGNLMQRADPYPLVLELARGKVNHVRSQAADWEAGGLKLTDGLREALRQMSRTFAQAACSQEHAERSLGTAQQAIDQAVRVGDELVRAYVQQVFEFRSAREKPISTTLACRIYGSPPDMERSQVFTATFNAVQVPFHWPTIEPAEGEYCWDTYDALLSWAASHGMEVVGGPVIEFAEHALPDWLERYHGDLRRIINYMDDYLEMVLQRYGDRIRTWELTAASNWPVILGLGRDELLHLTNRLFDTAHQLRPDLPLYLGLVQPWGEYLRHQERAYFPLLFADALLRNRANIAALSLEMVMGVQPRGSLLRDALEVSRILDLYALLGLPLRVTLGCPSASTSDALAAKGYSVMTRGTPDDWSPEVQSRWAEQCVSLAVCKPFVEAVAWAHFADDQPHWLPHGGIVAANGQTKPVAEPIQKLRRAYLR